MPPRSAATPPSDRPLYYLVAPAGFPNYGDELIAASWLRYLAEVAPEAEVWLDTHSPGLAAVLHGDEHPRVRFTDTLWRLCGMANDRGDDAWHLTAWVQEVVHNPAMAPRHNLGIELLARADVVHVLGGGYINKLWPHQIGLLAGAVAAVRRSGGKAAMTGQGLVPAADDTEVLLRTLADHFEVVDVRDEPSAELLGVPVGLDDAFLGIGPQLHAELDNMPEVVLCLQSDLTEVGIGKVAGAALSMLRDWKVPPEKVMVVEGIPRVDHDIYALIKRELPGARFRPFPELWRRGVPVSATSPSQVWISTRFHLHLVAAAAGASGVALSVHPDYYATKHRSLTAVGSGWTILDDLSQVPEKPHGGGFAPERVDEHQHTKRELAKSIYPEPSSQGRLSRIFRGQQS